MKLVFRPSFIQFAGLLLGPLVGLSRADEVRILEDPVDSFVSRIELIDSTRETLDIVCYHWMEDEAGFRVLNAMEEAADRGVRIRFVLDGVAHMVSRATWRWLEEESRIEFRLFNSPRPFSGNFHYRVHDKLIIADGEGLITGGRNIANPYFLPNDKKPYSDRDIFLSGVSVSESAEYFDYLWGSSNPLTRAERRSDSHSAWNSAGPASVAWRKGEAEELAREATQRIGKRIEDATSDTFLPDSSSRSRTYEVSSSRVRFYHDRIPKRNPDNATAATALYEIFGQAEEELIIQTPYIIPTKRLSEVFRFLVAEGVRVVVYTNSLGSSANLLAQSGMWESQEKLVADGVEMWKHYGPVSMHDKSFVIDGRIGIVGSFNLDPRSENLNTENFVVVEDKTFAMDLLRAMRIHEEHYRLVKKGEAGSLIRRIITEPGAGLPKNLAMPVLRVLSPLYRRRL